MGQEPSFYERQMTTIKVELNGKQYALKRYTIAREIEIQKEFGSIESFHQGLQKQDVVVLIKTLFILMEPNDDFKSWEDLAANLSGDPMVKMNISEAISLAMFQAMPEVSEALKKRSNIAREQLRKTTETITTGLLSITDSSKPMDGPAEK